MGLLALCMPHFHHHTPCQARRPCLGRINGIPHTFRVRHGRSALLNQILINCMENQRAQKIGKYQIWWFFLNPFLSWFPRTALRIIADYYAFVWRTTTTRNFWRSFLNASTLWEANVRRQYVQCLPCLCLPVLCKFKYLEVLLCCCMQGVREAANGRFASAARTFQTAAHRGAIFWSDFPRKWSFCNHVLPRFLLGTFKWFGHFSKV